MSPEELMFSIDSFRGLLSVSQDLSTLGCLSPENESFIGEVDEIILPELYMEVSRRSAPYRH